MHIILINTVEKRKIMIVKVRLYVRPRLRENNRFRSYRHRERTNAHIHIYIYIYRYAAYVTRACSCILPRDVIARVEPFKLTARVYFKGNI